jgi:hypothetical protein
VRLSQGSSLRRMRDAGNVTDPHAFGDGIRKA